MTFLQAITVVFRKYAEFRGTASRPEFWWWVLFTVLVNAALGSLTAWQTTAEGTFQVGPSLTGLWGIAVFLPSLAVAVRRLRAAGYPWGHLFWLLLPVAGVIILAVLCAQPDRIRTADERLPGVAGRPAGSSPDATA